MVQLAGSLPILLAVLLGAVFIRLARGMPQIPYEKLPAEKARGATRAFRHLTRSYVLTFVIFLIAITGNLLAHSAYSALERDDVPSWVVMALALVDGLVLVAIYSLVRSDIKLANIQADLLDDVIAYGSNERAGKTRDNVKKSFDVDRRPTPAITSLTTEEDSKEK